MVVTRQHFAHAHKSARVRRNLAGARMIVATLAVAVIAMTPVFRRKFAHLPPFIILSGASSLPYYY
jgi:hypothetical protein